MITFTRHQEDKQAKLSLPHQDDCKTRKDIKQCTTKHGTNTESHNGSITFTMNQQQKKYRLRMGAKMSDLTVRCLIMQ